MPLLPRGLDVAELPCVWATARAPSLNLTWPMCTFPAHVDLHLSSPIQRHGCVECSDIAFMLGLMQPHKAAFLVDLGSTIGMYALAAAAAGHSVVAFEPVPANAVRLLSSLRRNHWSRRVHLHAMCLSDRPGLCHLDFSDHNQGSVRHRIEEATTPVQAALSSAAVRLDDVLPPQRRPVFIKMDLEGSECRALSGMSSFLNGSSPIVGALFEWDKSAHCCKRLLAPVGAFAVLEQEHGLCAYIQQDGTGWRPVQPASGLCSLHVRAGVQVNLRWLPCKTSVQHAAARTAPANGE